MTGNEIEGRKEERKKEGRKERREEGREGGREGGRKKRRERMRETEIRYPEILNHKRTRYEVYLFCAFLSPFPRYMQL